jgi:lactoylglutathione lyase
VSGRRRGGPPGPGERTDDLSAAHAWQSARGARFTAGGIRRGAAGHDVCSIQPKGDGASPIGGQAALIELVQAPPAVIEALGHTD